MTPERFQKVGDLYDQAMELEPERRDAFLREACADDEELRREVESLLAAHESAEGFIDQPAVEIAAGLFANQTSSSIEEKKIGNYQALALIGKGGMGEVYLANDLKLRRKMESRFRQHHGIDAGISSPAQITDGETGWQLQRRASVARSGIEVTAHSRLSPSVLLGRPRLRVKNTQRQMRTGAGVFRFGQFIRLRLIEHHKSCFRRGLDRRDDFLESCGLTATSLKSAS